MSQAAVRPWYEASAEANMEDDSMSGQTQTTVGHTPGPWSRTEGDDFKHDSSRIIRGPGGEFIATALDRNRFDIDAEVEATARLIAAAPELLAALEKALPILERDARESLARIDFDSEDASGKADGATAVVEMARAAIARATGQSGE